MEGTLLWARRRWQAPLRVRFFGFEAVCLFADGLNE